MADLNCHYIYSVTRLDFIWDLAGFYHPGPASSRGMAATK
jgi:hypothetical protein